MNVFERVKSSMTHSGADVFSIGQSALGLPILCAHCGGGGRQIIITAAMHARECYTALVALEQIRRAQTAFAGGERADGAYFIPLVNPDGALFFENGLNGGRMPYCGLSDRSERYDVLARSSEAWSVWKANADGVDLNCNFDANWGGGSSNKVHVAPSDFIGNYPLCASESRALAEFTRRVAPAATVSYHCMGGELYWEFFQSGIARERDERFAAAIASEIGVKKVDGHLFSAGGYKDWCVSALGIPAVTVELIDSGSHPFTPDDYVRDIQKNARLPLFIHDTLGELGM